MKNKVTVTRAHRLKSVPFKEIPDGTICLKSSGITIGGQTEARIALKTGHALICLSDDYYLDYELPKDGTYITFPSFDVACAWVANGRRLEDLHGDSESEYVTTPHLGFGQLAKVIDNKGFGRFKWGDVIIAATGPSNPSPIGICSLIDGDSCSYTRGESLTGIENIVVWPIRFDLGDTITIEITE